MGIRCRAGTRGPWSFDLAVDDVLFADFTDILDFAWFDFNACPAFDDCGGDITGDAFDYHHYLMTMSAFRETESTPLTTGFRVVRLATPDGVRAQAGGDRWEVSGRVVTLEGTGASPRGGHHGVRMAGESFEPRNRSPERPRLTEPPDHTRQTGAITKRSCATASPCDVQIALACTTWMATSWSGPTRGTSSTAQRP